ncbi:DUF6291 domain-containing protein [Polaribacter tangerinus]|uniref:DUF6291 domain-containing protein n=1 Tax=Polaribacter tangerinus TaxID=1920034 RepID=UPI000B4A6713|nr:DUF6291 domain-containing protein [Polaribacter tangerinus]
MKTEKKSFLFYHSWKSSIDLIDDSTLRKFVNNLISYHEGAELVLESVEDNLLWNGVLPALELNNLKYNERIEKNRENGKKGGRPRKINAKKEEPNGLFDKPKKPNGLFDKPKKPDNSKKIIVNRKQEKVKTEEIIDDRELINQIGKKEIDYGELKNNELKQELREGIRKQFPNYSDFQTITSPEEILSCRERTPDYVWNKVEEDLIKISILSGYK